MALESGELGPAGSPGRDPVTGLYPGQSTPLATLTPSDQGGALVIGAALALIFALISFFIRLYVRIQFQRGFARDDAIAAAGMVFFIIQSGLVFGEVRQGFGKTMEDIPTAGLVALQKIGYVSDIFYLLAIWLTKCTIGYLFIRLSPDRLHIRAAYVILAIATAFTVVSVLTTCLRCNLQAPWLFINTQCPGLLDRWKAVAALDIVSEIALFAVAVYMTHGLKVSMSKKSVVLFAFGLRLLVIIPILTRLVYLGDKFSSSNPTLDGVLTAISTQIQICYAIIATTTPCLRPFMSALNTHYGGPKEPKTPSGTKLSASKLSKQSGNSDGSKRSATAPKSGHVFPLEDMTTTTRTVHVNEEEDTKANRQSTFSETKVQVSPVRPTSGRWDRSGSDYRVAVVSRNLSGSARSMQSNDSRRVIISMDTEWQVEYQGGEAASASMGSRHS